VSNFKTNLYGASDYARQCLLKGFLSATLFVLLKTEKRQTSDYPGFIPRTKMNRNLLHDYFRLVLLNLFTTSLYFTYRS